MQGVAGEFGEGSSVGGFGLEANRMFWISNLKFQIGSLGSLRFSEITRRADAQPLAENVGIDGFTLLFHLRKNNGSKREKRHPCQEAIPGDSKASRESC